ncbi:butyrate kinase 2 [Oxobacter pfennigii]|uniref:Probable butyrate kinase n=1 Tax=Oxobacter pfennigii TaxID=36849 RepID=A0A0P9ALQ4_9CLOT|nr:butyrate kinase [Oxobacter pfennigii]KPU46323.1 butyrate kinase 2 [Oxobacter pfennigii]
MKPREYILAVNPGSTSTKVALFAGETNIRQKSLNHSPEEIKKFDRISGQFQFRTGMVLNWLREEAIELGSLSAVVGRGGILRPMPGGTYKVTDIMIEDLKSASREEHASNLGAMIAKAIADREGIPSFIVDPVAVDEFEDLARISGMREIPRRSLVHALNVKAVSRRIAKQYNKRLEDINLIVAHLGGGITIAPVRGGKIIDANVANDMGPFSPERAGGVPVGDLIRLIFSGKYNQKEIKKKTVGEAGLVAYLGTNDAREVEDRIRKGDEYAKIIYESMCYQVSKEIGSMAAVLYGKVDAIVVTGGLAYSEYFVNYISKMVKFIAPVEVVAGEDEMLALAQGAARVINGEEIAKIYEDEVEIND